MRGVRRESTKARERRDRGKGTVRSVGLMTLTRRNAGQRCPARFDFFILLPVDADSSTPDDEQPKNID